MKYLRSFNESFVSQIDSDYKFEKKFGISMEELDDYLLEFSDHYPVKIYHEGSRKANYTSFKISIEVPFVDPDLEISGLINRLKRHSLMIYRNGYIRDEHNWPSFMNKERTKLLTLEVKPEVVMNKRGRKINEKIVNESLRISQGFMDNFNLSKKEMEDIEDYLVELTDEYDVLITDGLSRYKKSPINGFDIVIAARNTMNVPDFDLDSFFDPHIIMIRMENFIRRVKNMGIEFLEFHHNSHMGQIDYTFKKYKRP